MGSHDGVHDAKKACSYVVVPIPVKGFHNDVPLVGGTQRASSALMVSRVHFLHSLSCPFDPSRKKKLVVKGAKGKIRFTAVPQVNRADVESFGMSTTRLYDWVSRSRSTM